MLWLVTDLGRVAASLERVVDLCDAIWRSILKRRVESIGLGCVIRLLNTRGPRRGTLKECTESTLATQKLLRPSAEVQYDKLQNALPKKRPL